MISSSHRTGSTPSAFARRTTADASGIELFTSCVHWVLSGGSFGNLFFKTGQRHTYQKCISIQT